MTKHPSLRLFLLFVVIALGLLRANQNIVEAQDAENSAFLSPIEPTATPVAKFSPQATLALEYVSKEYQIPLSSLQIANEEVVNYALSERKFVDLAIWTLPPTEHREFYLLVDLANNQLELDVQAIKAAEEKRYKAKYGKLNPELYEQLQSATDDEMFSVALWLLPAANTRTQDELYRELIAKYPEAEKANQVMGAPWGVDDKELAAKIRGEYVEMLAQDIRLQTQPFLNKLQQLGIEEVTAFDGMPSVAVRTSKRHILEIEKYEEVDQIYSSEGEIVPSMSEAIPTDRVPASWYQGTLSGAGRRIALVEPTNIDTTTGCLSIIATRNAPDGGYDSLHKTRVASVAACNHVTYRGMGYNASLIDAAFNPQTNLTTHVMTDVVPALDFAINTHVANVVNASWTYTDT